MLKIPNKKVRVGLVILLILAASGGFFWWENREIKGSPDDYAIKETGEGKIIENKKAGLSIIVPKEWKTEIIDFSEGSVIFDSLDIEGVWRNEMISPPLIKGCSVEVAVIYRQTNFDEIKKEVEESHIGLSIQSEEFEIITINNRQTLKDTFESKFIGPSMGVYFLNEDKFYSFAVYWASNDKERCIQEFNNLLKTVSIK